MMIEPTVEQTDQCAIVQQDVIELIERLTNEGIDLRVVLAGLAAATSFTVMKAYGPKEVPVWFARQSAMTMAWARD